MTITMSELAKLANVSQGAVSLVLNGKAHGQISQKKQDLILALAREYHYRVNMTAKSLRKKRQYAVGVIMPTQLNQFYASLIPKIQTLLSGYGYMALFSFLGNGNIESVYNSLYERQIDGIISWQSCPEMFHDNIPAVFFQEQMDRKNSGIPDCRIFRRCGFDYRNSCRELYQYLYDLGHRRIGFVGIESDSRFHLLKSFMAETGDGSCCFFRHSDSLCTSDSWADSIFSMPDRPTALVTTNDETARQLIFSGARFGIRFPEDISITGFMNLPYTQTMYPALTTMDSKEDELAQLMVSTLISIMEEPESPVEDRFINPELIIRESCASPAKQGNGK